MLAQRIVDDVGVARGARILIRAGVGGDVAEAVERAVVAAAGYPTVEETSPAALSGLLRSFGRGDVAAWEAERIEVLRSVDRIIKLAGDAPNLGDVSAGVLAEWRDAIGRLSDLEDARRIPSVLVALPTPGRAAHLGISLEAMECALVPALLAPPGKLRSHIDRVLDAIGAARMLTVRTGRDTYTLNVPLESRPWHADDGVLDASDLDGGQVANLPAGALYSTVPEEGVEGALYLKQAGPARDVVLRFREGRVAVEAGEGGAELDAVLDGASGESRRISHIGIGLNPYLSRWFDWVLVDEHRAGALILALGENRYLGGRNVSSLNLDVCSQEATILADGRTIVEYGRVVV